MCSLAIKFRQQLLRGELKRCREVRRTSVILLQLPRKVCISAYRTRLTYRQPCSPHSFQAPVEGNDEEICGYDFTYAGPAQLNHDIKFITAKLYLTSQNCATGMDGHEPYVHPLQSIQVGNINRREPCTEVQANPELSEPGTATSSEESRQFSARASAAGSTYNSTNSSEISQDGPLPPGYPALAARMSLIPEIAIFRRFGSANAQNLLYLQAEILHLENSLRHLQIRDSKSRDQRTAWHAVDWWHMAHSSDQDRNDEQWKLVQELRQKLREYSKFKRQASLVGNRLLT